MQYNQNLNLKNYNSFRLDSIVKEIWFPESKKELQQILKELQNKKFFILANGTNIILKPEIERIICLKKMPKQRVLLTDGIWVTANYSTTVFVLKSIENRIIGFEGLYGIPGTIGGAIFMNAGSGKYTVSDYLEIVTTMDLNGRLHNYNKSDLKFERRYSNFQDQQEIIIEALFSFQCGEPNIEQIELSKIHRKSLPKQPSAGGIFINWQELKPYQDKLIGLKIGDAEISEKVNIIINKGNAIFEDIIKLINEIQKIVKNSLKLEIKILG